MKNVNAKRSIAVILCALMLGSLFPVSVLAEDYDPVAALAELGEFDLPGDPDGGDGEDGELPGETGDSDTDLPEDGGEGEELPAEGDDAGLPDDEDGDEQLPGDGDGFDTPSDDPPVKVFRPVTYTDSYG